MNTEDIKKMALALQAVQEASKKKMDPVGKEDDDIDNDGDEDKTDEYLHARRKAVSAAIKAKGMKEEAEQIDEKIKVGDIVRPKDGPHAGHPHAVRYKLSNGNFDIKPIGLKYHEIKYRSGPQQLNLGSGVGNESNLEKVKDKSEVEKYKKAHAKDVAKTLKKWHEEVEVNESDLSNYTIEELKDFIMSEEFEQLDEISQDKLRDYHAAAALDLKKKREKLDKGTLTSKDYKQGQNRVTGLNRSAAKMEEVEELDELSKETLGSYVKKASRNLAGREYKRGAEKDTSTANLQKSYKRDMGISKAIDKMTKEEVDEAKLTDKQVKAALSAAKAKPKDKVSLKPAPWDMKEERWPVYNRIKEAKDAHLKSATAPEAIDSKASKGEKDFVKLHGGLKGNDSGIDGAKAALQTAQSIVSKVKTAVKRPGDNSTGDKSIIKSTEAK